MFRVEKLRHKQPCRQRSSQKCMEPSSLLSRPFSDQTYSRASGSRGQGC